MSAPDPNAPPTPQEWLAPATLPYAYQSPETTVAVPMFELRPLSMSEVLDRTFTLYRSRFWLFAGIASLAGAVHALFSAAQMLMQGSVLHPAVGQKLSLANLASPGLTLFASLLFFLAYSVTTAATVFAVGEIYLDRTASVQSSLRATLGRWSSYVAIAIWQACSMAWLPLLLLVPALAILFARPAGMIWLGGLLLVLGATAGLVGGYIFYLRNAFGVPAAVTERLKVRGAMRRSKVLSAGTKGRMFVVQLVSIALYMVVGILQTPIAFAMAFTMKRSHSQSYGLEAIVVVIGFLGHTLVAPVAAIGLTLLYFDQRVRLEAFDIAVLLGEERAVEAGAPAVDAAPQSIEPYQPLAPSNEAQASDAPLA